MDSLRQFEGNRHNRIRQWQGRILEICKNIKRRFRRVRAFVAQYDAPICGNLHKGLRVETRDNIAKSLVGINQRYCPFGFQARKIDVVERTDTTTDKGQKGQEKNG